MIAYLEGQVIYSDGREVILKTNQGVGFQVYFAKSLPEKTEVAFFISQVIRETSQDLYGFLDIREKVLFETLNGVKGVGPKSSYALIRALGHQQLFDAIHFERKKVLMEAPGIGAKAAAQIILDLSAKIKKLEIFSHNYRAVSLPEKKIFDGAPIGNGELELRMDEDEKESLEGGLQDRDMINDALMACVELGFSESHVLPLMNNILERRPIKHSEQLVHLVLKEI